MVRSRNIIHRRFYVFTFYLLVTPLSSITYVRYRYILKGQRLLTLNAKAERLLKQIPETDSPYVFRNPKTGAEYKLHEFYYLHKKILKQARLPWVAFRDLQHQCMEVGI